MTKRHWPLLLAAIGLTVLAAGSALAFSFSELVGQWFTELEEDETYLGERYTIRKQIEDNRPDGTKTATFRFYDNCRYIGELVNELEWGVDKDVYWTKCKSITQAGVTVPCSATSYYDLTAVTKTALRYTSRDSGIAYTMTRVESGFKIPPSACTSALGGVVPAALRSRR